MTDLPPPTTEAGRRIRRADLHFAAGYFTCLPFSSPSFSKTAAPEPGALARAAWAFPVIGMIIGLLCGLAYEVAALLGLPPVPAALLAVGTGVLITGAVHEDGLAATAEALPTKGRARSGTFAMLALIFSVLLRAAAVAVIANVWAVVAAFVAAHAVARGFLPLVFTTLPETSVAGTGPLAGKPARTAVIVSVLIAVILAVAALHPRPGLFALLAAALVMAIIAMLARRRLGGYTGDVLGAIEQGGEAAMLLAISVWLW